MRYKLLYHPAIRDDLKKINEKLKKRIKKVLETRTATVPERYGEPLRKTLKGYWKMRVGDYRIVYRIVKQEIIILAIVHRKNIYKVSDKRKG